MLGESLVLHPSIAVGAGYDTNVFYASNTVQTDPATGVQALDLAQGAFYMLARPGIDLATRPAQRDNAPHNVDFRLFAGMPLRFLLSSDPDINKHYSIGVDSGLHLTLFPTGEWSFELFDNYVRTSEPPYAVVKAAFDLAPGANIDTDQNQLGGALHWRPGGQRFETTLQYVFGAYYFESTPLAAKTNLYHDFQLRVKWNFFPKTALYVNASETINTYLNSQVTNAPPTAYPLRAVVGLLGLITTQLRLNVNVGYGNSFTQDKPPTYVNNTSYSSVVGLVELGWKPGLLTDFTIGYRHDFAQALIGTYYDLDTAYAALAQLVWRFNVQLRLAWERRGFHGNLAPDGLANLGSDPSAANRVDNILGFHAEIAYPIRDYLAISVGDDLTKNWSNCRFLSAQGGPPCDYFRNDVWLRLTLAY